MGLTFIFISLLYFRVRVLDILMQKKEGKVGFEMNHTMNGKYPRLSDAVWKDREKSREIVSRQEQLGSFREELERLEKAGAGFTLPPTDESFAKATAQAVRELMEEEEQERIRSFREEPRLERFFSRVAGPLLLLLSMVGVILFCFWRR